ncbi:response regulator, partial [Escherichia coli]
MPRETSVESSPEREQPRLVLVVEDEEALRGIVVMMVEKLGYQAMEAGNGPEALALVENQDLRPDVLLTDF